MNSLHNMRLELKKNRKKDLVRKAKAQYKKHEKNLS